MLSFDKDEQIRTIARTRSGFPVDHNIMNVKGLENVTFIDPLTNTAISDGEIPDKVILKDMEFDHPVEIIAERVILHDVKLGKGVKRIPANTIISRGEIDELEEAPEQSKRISRQPAFLFNCHKKGKVLVYRGMVHASLSLEYAKNEDLQAHNLSATDTPLAIAPIYFDLKDAIVNQHDFYLYPGIVRLNQTMNMLDQSFIIEDEDGKPKLLGLNFFQVRGD
jgi:hypothetical protein